MKTNAHILASAIEELLEDLYYLRGAEKHGNEIDIAFWDNAVRWDIAALKRITSAENFDATLKELLGKHY